MKRLLPLIATLFAIACCAAQNLRKVPLADPFILLYDGVYYAYGTGAGSGIEVWTSRDLSTWERAKGNARDGLALHRTDVWGEKWFWAPEVYRLNDKFYMYFDRFNDGLNIWVVELEDDCTTLKKETMRPCIHVSQEWEKVWPRVNEGCFVIRRNGTYYMTYSANSYESPFYGIGCATADSPLGPWTKYDRNPLLQNPGELVGVGHSALFRDKAGNLKIVFHAHKSKGAIHPREMYITDVRFRPVEGGCRMEIDPGLAGPDR